MMDIQPGSLAALILAGHNQGRTAKAQEQEEKEWVGRIYREQFIIGRNKSLLTIDKPPESRHFGIVSMLHSVWKDREERKQAAQENLGTSLERVIEACQQSRYINKEEIYPIGPKLRIQRTVKDKGIHIQQQGSDLQENIELGMSALHNGAFYSQEYLLIISGDVPLVTGDDIDIFVENSQKRGIEGVEMYAAVVSRKDLAAFITKKDLAAYGIPRFNDHPLLLPLSLLPGNLRKFGIPLNDKETILTGRDIDMYMSGNMFLAQVNAVDEKSSMIPMLYSKRRIMGEAYQSKGFRGLLDLGTGKWSVLEAEQMFREEKGIHGRMVLVPPHCSLDIDTWKDRMRCSAYLFRQKESQ